MEGSVTSCFPPIRTQAGPCGTIHFTRGRSISLEDNSRGHRNTPEFIQCKILISYRCEGQQCKSHGKCRAYFCEQPSLEQRKLLRLVLKDVILVGRGVADDSIDQWRGIVYTFRTLIASQRKAGELSKLLLLSVNQ